MHMHIAKAGKNSILGRKESTIRISGQKIRNGSFELLSGCCIHGMQVGEFHRVFLSGCKKKLAFSKTNRGAGKNPTFQSYRTENRLEDLL